MNEFYTSIANASKSTNSTVDLSIDVFDLNADGVYEILYSESGNGHDYYRLAIDDDGMYSF